MTSGPPPGPAPIPPSAPGIVTRTVTLPTAADTAALGRHLGARLVAGDLVVLAGPLGAGKTCLAHGIGEGMGVQGPVTSPTFVIAREHPPRPDARRGVTLVHVDAYRLGGAGAEDGSGDPGGPGGPVGGDDIDVEAHLDALDLDSDLSHAAVVVEWGEGVVESLAPDHLRVRLDRADDEVRTAELTGPARLVEE